MLATLSSAAGVSLIGRPNAFAQQAPPETTTIRIAKIAGICVAPQYVADELLRAEGFTDIRYVATDSGTPAALSLARGEVDFTANYAPPIIVAIDAGEPITIVAGEHVGCFELFANEGIRSIRGFQGQESRRARLGVKLRILSEHHGRLCRARSRQGYPLGAESSTVKPMELFAEDKIDAFLGIPPEPQELRARKIGHVIVNSSLDRPWSQYFCCMLAAQPGLRPQESGCDQARVARDPQGG